MQKFALAAALIAAPVLAYAEVPEWAAPETSKEFRPIS